MATVRDGDRTALLVVDVQVGVLEGAWDADRVVGNVASVVQRARDAGVPVIWVQHHDGELLRDTPDWQWVPELGPADGEPVVHKTHESSFEETDLDSQLARVGATRLVLAGAATNWCIRATAYAALARGYDLTLVADAHTTEDQPLPDGSSLVPHLVDDLNTVMHWISYPGRDNTTAPAAELFVQPPADRDADPDAEGLPARMPGAPLLR